MMQILNREEYKNRPISELGFSGRTYNALMRAGYNTLFLLIENYALLPDVRNLGYKCMTEINDTLTEIQNSYGTILEKTVPLNDEKNELRAGKMSFPDEIANRPVTDLMISTHTRNIFKYKHINTIGEVSLLSREDILKFKSMGQHYIDELLGELKKVSEIGEEYFSRSYQNNQEDNQEKCEDKQRGNAMEETRSDYEPMFIQWLSKNVSSARLSELYMALCEIELQAKKEELIQTSVYEDLSISSINRICEGIKNNNTFMNTHKKQWGIIISALEYLLKFVQSNVESIEDTETEQKILKENASG